MDVTVVPTALNLMVLAELHPATCRPERIHAVLGWTDDGDRILRPLVSPRTAPGELDPQLLAALDPHGPAEQLSLQLGDESLPGSSASGLTWRSWVLPSIPTVWRHLPPAGVVGELARRLERPDR